MIFIILKSYAVLFSLVAFGSFVIFISGLYFILTTSKTRKTSSLKTKLIDLPDYTAISGEDVIATQLDLARAYIESDKTSLAKVILKRVLDEGNALHQQEAQQLLSSL